MPNPALPLGLLLLAACAATSPAPAVVAVHVASPTGVAEVDRRAVQAAFDAVEPGGEVLFAPGTYVLGRSVRLTVPDVTVLGHADGTVLRGGPPDSFDVDSFDEVPRLVLGCTGLELRAARQTLRGLTFEHAWHGILIGALPDTLEQLERQELPPDPRAGGHRIEGNTFRACSNGIRALSDAGETTVVCDNDFVDTYHAIVLNGGTVHFLDNRIRVEYPRRVPVARYPGDPLVVAPDSSDVSGRHVIAGNLVEGHPEGIKVHAWPGKRCSGIEIRDNTIRVRRVEVPEGWFSVPTTPEDPTLVGVAIRLTADAAEDGTPGVVEDVLVEGNRVLGAEGLGIELFRASRCRVVGNTVQGIRRRSPFPGHTLRGSPVPWEAANGSALWVSPGSVENVIAGNSFLDLDGPAVVLEGDRNRVDVPRVPRALYDLGRDNEATIGLDGQR